MGDGLYEVRSDLGGRRTARVLFCVAADHLVLLHGFIKKTRETPDSELKLARDRKRKMEGRAMTGTPHIGSSLDDLLEETGDLAEVKTVAIKRVIAWQVEEEMRRRQISKSTMAQRMHTSRAQVDRLLDPKNPSVTLNTLDHAARVLGRRLILELA